MKRFVNAVAAILIYAGPGTALAADVTLTVEKVSAQPGQTVVVPVLLDNPGNAVRGLQFTMSADPPALSLEDVQAVGRATGGTTPWEADASQLPDGTIRVVLVSLSAEAILPGTGPVLSLRLTIAGSVSSNVVGLDVTDVRVAGAADQSLSASVVAKPIDLAVAPPTGGGGGGGGGGGCTLRNSSQPASELIVIGLLAVLGLWMRRRISAPSPRRHP